MRQVLVPAVAVGLVACASARPPPSADLEATIVGLAQEMAANASALDVKQNLRLIPDTDKVVYVSNGAPITGKEYAEVLGASYAGRRSLAFRWDKWEVTPLGPTSAVYTGWATITVVPAKGEAVTQRFIFTMVFANDGHGWKRVIAHKSVLDEGA